MYRITKRLAENRVDRRSCTYCHDYEYFEEDGQTYFQTTSMCNRKGRLNAEDHPHMAARFTVPAEDYLIEEIKG